MEQVSLMPKGVRVDPADLRLAASQVDVAADRLRSRDTVAHGDIHVARAGWVGASAAALAGLVAQWEEESADHYTELISHSQDLQSAAADYTATDTGQALQIAGLAARMGM